MSILFENFTTGIEPFGQLFPLNDLFFGTTSTDDISGFGTLFSIGVDGSNYTVLHLFSGTDGSSPQSGVTCYNNNLLLGSTLQGGVYNSGVLYSFDISSSTFSVIHNFNFADLNGCNPYGTPLLIGNKLYGTTSSCGGGYGTIYEYDLLSSTFNLLYSMSSIGGGSSRSSLINIGRILYGTALNNGANGTGTIFSYHLDTLVYTLLYSFLTVDGSSSNASGANPYSGLLYNNNLFYGTTVTGGTNGSGVVYSITTNGSTFTTIHSFTSNVSGNGAFPYGGLIANNRVLYGITTQGGLTTDSSLLYSISITTNEFSILNSFGPYGYAYDSMIIKNNVLYGTLSVGGNGNNGAIFYYSLPIVCFKENSKILTDKGYVQIQDIKRGDLVKTIKHGYIPVHTIGKKEIFHRPSYDNRNKDQLYTCHKDQFPEMEGESELVITGCHSILVNQFQESEKKQTEMVLGGIFVTDEKYRLPACVDTRTKVFPYTGLVTLYHLALENDNYYMNYGIYAQGLLVETCSRRYIKELSGMNLF